MDRLLSSAPREGGHGKAWLLASQAITAYTIQMLGIQRDMAVMAIRHYELMDELRECPLGRIGAMDTALTEVSLRMKALESQWKAVETVAAEWCVKNHVNPDDFGNVYRLPPPRHGHRESVTWRCWKRQERCLQQTVHIDRIFLSTVYHGSTSKNGLPLFSLQPVIFVGAGERNRTSDLLITNQLLYRLSYSG